MHSLFNIKKAQRSFLINNYSQGVYWMLLKKSFKMVGLVLLIGLQSGLFDAAFPFEFQVAGPVQETLPVPGLSSFANAQFSPVGRSLESSMVSDPFGATLARTLEDELSVHQPVHENDQTSVGSLKCTPERTNKKNRRVSFARDVQEFGLPVQPKLDLLDSFLRDQQQSQRDHVPSCRADHPYPRERIRKISSASETSGDDFNSGSAGQTTQQPNDSCCACCCALLLKWLRS